MENNGTITHFEDFVKRPEPKVRALEKKAYVARFIEMLVKQGKDITPFVGKPLNHFDYDKIYTLVEEWEGKQIKIPLNTEENTKTKKG